MAWDQQSQESVQVSCLEQPEELSAREAKKKERTTFHGGQNLRSRIKASPSILALLGIHEDRVPVISSREAPLLLAVLCLRFVGRKAAKPQMVLPGDPHSLFTMRKSPPDSLQVFPFLSFSLQ